MLFSGLPSSVLAEDAGTLPAPHLATGRLVGARGGPRRDSWWAAGCRVSSFREWALNICSPPSAVGSFPLALIFGALRMKPGVEDLEQSLPHLGLPPHKIDPFLLCLLPPPLGLHPGPFECLDTHRYLHTGGLCSAKHWEAKNSPAPSGPVIGGGTAGFDKQESSVLWPAATCFH